MNEFDSVNEALDLWNRFWTEVFDVKVFCGIIAWVVVLIIELKFVRNYKRKDRRTAKALERGHVIHAKRISRPPGAPEINDHYCYAKYRYQVGDKTYTYRYMGTKFPPVDITLYYRNNPKRAWSTFNRSKYGLFFIVLPLLPFAVAVGVIFLLGGV